MNKNQIVERIIEGYERSTKNNNTFLKAIKSIKWEKQFKCEDGYYFIYEDITLETLTLNPFETYAIIWEGNNFIDLNRRGK